MDNRYENYMKIADRIKTKLNDQPEVALILGSGLGGMIEEMKVYMVIPYEDIEGFPVPTVTGHAGRMIYGEICGKKILAFQGRKHYYECKDMEQATIIIRIIKSLGIDKLILTNAAGGIGRELKVGDIMLIRDHISSFIPSPLVGANIEELGPRFPDMTNVYNKELAERILKNVEQKRIELKQGVYLQTTGPNYETPAEIKMYSMLGADAVGMSTACEAMVARHMGMLVCGFSCITNMAAGLGHGELSHKEVAVAADGTADVFKNIVKIAIECI